MQLLDLYRSRFGEAVKRQGNGWNGPCPLCGGEPGKSDRFMVWPDRSDNLGEACSRNGINGIWSCRQCSASGDTIAYLMKIDGMTFKEALAELGIEGVKTGWHRRKLPLNQCGTYRMPGRQRSSPSPQPNGRGAPSSWWRKQRRKSGTILQHFNGSRPEEFVKMPSKNSGLAIWKKKAKNIMAASGRVKPSDFQPKLARTARFMTNFLSLAA